MKKMNAVLIAALLLAGCGTAAPEAEKQDAVNGSTNETAEVEEQEAVAEEATTEAAIPETIDPESIEETEAAEEVEVTTPSGIQVYMPEAGLVKKFTVDSFDLVREVKEVQGNKVLEEVAFGDMKAVQVTEWTETGMNMLIDTAELSGIKDISIEGLVPTSAPISVINEENNEASEWQVVGPAETLETPAGTLEDVIAVSQVTTSETSDQVTTITQYFAPGLGFVKETSTVKNGDNEQTSVVELVSYE
ncbi:hypothetical protein [Planococcus sp. YIM B11945]|uniref:hypothetical protein n=1 Tax=Planococcus sp. YIM B11945 TaxID=3435410 RepID=UPI003D7E02E4